MSKSTFKLIVYLSKDVEQRVYEPTEAFWVTMTVLSKKDPKVKDISCGAR